MNLNQLAIEVARLEGKKKPVSIAQIKEVLRCLGVVLATKGAGLSLVYITQLVCHGERDLLKACVREAKK